MSGHGLFATQLLDAILLYSKDTNMRYLLLGLITLTSLSGCAIVAVADAVVTTGAVVVKAGAKTVGAVVDAVLPDKKSEAEKDKK